MATARKLREDIIYEQQFGMIPNDQMERIAYILGKKVNEQKFNKDVEKTAKRIKLAKKTTLKFTMWNVFKPSRRPRVNTRGGYIQMYVPNAAENGK